MWTYNLIIIFTNKKFCRNSIQSKFVGPLGAWDRIVLLINVRKQRQIIALNLFIKHENNLFLLFGFNCCFVKIIFNFSFNYKRLLFKNVFICKWHTFSRQCNFFCNSCTFFLNNNSAFEILIKKKIMIKLSFWFYMFQICDVFLCYYKLIEN